MTAATFKGKIFPRFTKIVGAVREWRSVDLSRADTSRIGNQRLQRGHGVNHPKTKQELRRALLQLKARYDARRLIGQGTDKPRRAA